MKAISLWQPWASLIAHGLKRIETRHWSTNYRGPLLIHAAKRWTRAEQDALLNLRVEFPSVGRIVAPPVLGAIVAVAQLVDCREMTEAWIGEQGSLERAVGGWSPGRFGWVLEDVKPFGAGRCVPWRGAQGLFEVPGHVVVLEFDGPVLVQPKAVRRG